MPEQILGPNTGVGTATDGGGGNNMNTDQTAQTQGGGNAAIGGGTDNTSGSSGSSGTGFTGVELGGLAVAIAGLTALSNGFLPDDEDLLEIFMNKKMGFDKLEEKATAENPDVDPEKIKDMVAEQRVKVKEHLKGPGKAAFKDKVDSLKQEIKKIIDGAAEIAVEVTASTTEATMPPVLGPVGPNPISVVIKFSLVIIRIMGKVGLILAGVVAALKLMDELGLSDNPAAEKIKEAAKPVLEIQDKLKELANKFKKDAEDAEDGYIDQHPQAGEDNIPDNAKITGMELKAEAASKYGINDEWPLKKKNRKMVNKMIKEKDGYTEADAEWGQAFWDYHTFLKRKRNINRADKANIFMNYDYIQRALLQTTNSNNLRNP